MTSATSVIAASNCGGGLKRRKLAHFDLQKASVCAYFSDENDEQKWLKVKPIMEGKCSRISLRLIDFFVTSYARSVLCETKSGVNVYHSMQAALQGLNKKRLDPFNRLHVGVDDSVQLHGIKTNVAQLSFFRWALQTGALDFLQDHLEEVRAKYESTTTPATPSKPKTVVTPSAGSSSSHDSRGSSVTSATEEASASETNMVHEIIIDLPPLTENDDPKKNERLKITLRERLQTPKKRRKRICPSKVETLARCSTAQSVVDIKGIRG